jgi:hypothetical protein
MTTPTYNIYNEIPGVYLQDGGPYDGQYHIPIFCSIPNYCNNTPGSNACSGENYLVMNDRDNYYLLMPGYSIIVYTEANYVGSYTIMSNTTDKIKSYPTNYGDRGSSCKVYYNSIEIKSFSYPV